MCLACGSAWRVDPRVALAQVHPPARAVRPRPLVSDSPLRRGSFALGTGRIPMSKPHVPCMWKRRAGRPAGGADPSPPTSTRCSKAPSFGIGQSLAAWIIRPRYGPQPDEQAACGFDLICMWKRLAGRPTAGAGPLASPTTHQQAVKGTVVRNRTVACAVDHSHSVRAAAR